MAVLQTPVCDFGAPLYSFELTGADTRIYRLEDIRGPQGTLIMFISNHCPYVKAILPRLLTTVLALQAAGIGCVAINANDPTEYPEDRFEQMQILAKAWSFPYLWDETQRVAECYGAVCTPDFFGYNAAGELQYRGRLDSSGRQPAPAGAKEELLEAMLLVVKTGRGPVEQVPSQGCSIKWRMV